MYLKYFGSNYCDIQRSTPVPSSNTFARDTLSYYPKNIPEDIQEYQTTGRDKYAESKEVTSELRLTEFNFYAARSPVYTHLTASLSGLPTI